MAQGAATIADLSAAATVIAELRLSSNTTLRQREPDRNSAATALAISGSTTGDSAKAVAKPTARLLTKRPRDSSRGRFSLFLDVSPPYCTSSERPVDQAVIERHRDVADTPDRDRIVDHHGSLIHRAQA